MQAVDIVRLHWCFCNLEHMCYLNVQAGIAIENANWLFVTAKKTWKAVCFFLGNLQVAQSDYEKITDLGFGGTPYIVILPR
jgi:hypothetical protein